MCSFLFHENYDLLYFLNHSISKSEMDYHIYICIPLYVFLLNERVKYVRMSCKLNLFSVKCDLEVMIWV